MVKSELGAALILYVHTVQCACTCTVCITVYACFGPFLRVLYYEQMCVLVSKLCNVLFVGQLSQYCCQILWFSALVL